MKTTYIYIYPYPMSPTSMSGSCRLLCYMIRQKSSDYLSLARNRKDIIVVIILLSYEIYTDDNWRPDGMELWIWSWLGIRARLGLHLFRLCRLRTVRCCGWQSSHRLIILSTYLLMRARRLVTLLSWVLALFGPTLGVGTRWRSKHHTETGSQVLGAWSPSLDGTWTP